MLKEKGRRWAAERRRSLRPCCCRGDSGGTQHKVHSGEEKVENTGYSTPPNTQA